MSRLGTLFATVLPSMIAGGLLLGSAPAASETTGALVVAQADPRPRSWSRSPVPPVPPTPPVPGTYAVPPVPPAPHRGHGRGISVSIHDGRIEIDGIEELVQDQLERVAAVLDNLPDVPPDVRDRVKGRVKSVRDRLRARFGRLRSLDLDRIGPEMERMGEEIERDMEGLDEDLEQLGAKLGKHFAEKFGRDFARSFGPSHLSVPGGHDRDHSDDGDDDDDDADDDTDAEALPPNLDADLVDPSDRRAAIAGLKDLHLDPGQQQQLARLRADSERQITEAKRELEAMSDRLHDALGDAGASEADVARQIDLISAKEATIRKARILAWMKVRTLLDQDQRKKVEAAARRPH
jgi:hypothetical protein